MEPKVQQTKSLETEETESSQERPLEKHKEEKIDKGLSESNREAMDKEQATNNEIAEDAETNTLEDVLAERDEYISHLQRLKAEFDNYRKRVTREKEQLIKRGNRTLILELLDVLDNFERALEAAHEAGEQASGFTQGLDMTARMLLTTLHNRGLKPIPALGERFDPEIHEAMSMEAREDVEPGTVVHEWQRGYWLGEQVLRPSKVVVSMQTSPEENQESPQSDTHPINQ